MRIYIATPPIGSAKSIIEGSLFSYVLIYGILEGSVFAASFIKGSLQGSDCCVGCGFVGNSSAGGSLISNWFTVARLVRDSLGGSLSSGNSFGSSFVSDSSSFGSFLDSNSFCESVVDSVGSSFDSGRFVGGVSDVNSGRSSSSFVGSFGKSFISFVGGSSGGNLCFGGFVGGL